MTGKIFNKKWWLLIGLIILAGNVFANKMTGDSIAIIPYPAELKLLENESFIINNKTPIYISQNDPILYQLDWEYGCNNW
ncbi:hypothetical protein [Niabella aquatica]